MASKALHPQNGRVGTAGLPASAGLTYRYPPMFVALEGDRKHETPLCPDVQGQPHEMVCREEALYVYGEKRCQTCRMHSISTDGSGWTDPRYQRPDGDSDE